MLRRENKKIAIILNPTAGRGRAYKAEKEILNCLRERNIQFHLEHTTKPLHAIDIAKRLSTEYSMIIAVGGDGTANEVAQGIINNKSTLAYLPIGSGNDFNRILSIPKKINEAIDVILNGTEKRIDIGKVWIENSSLETKESFFINTLGIGIDANIAKEVKQIKYIRGLLLYLIAAIKVLISFKPIKFNIKIDNSNFEEDLYLCCVGNGKFEGGGFMMVPEAIPDDGYFHNCLAKKMPVSDAFKAIPMVIKGTHKNHPKIIMQPGKEIELSSQNNFVIHVDGEILEDNARKVKVELEKEKLKVIIAQ